MPQSISQVVISLVPALLVASFTSWLTVRLSLRRFRAERWWDHKAEAYSRIVEALHNLVEYCSVMSDAAVHRATISDARQKELSDNYNSAYRDLRKAAGIGAYIISDEVASTLSKLEARPRLGFEDNAPWDVYDDDSAAYKKALEQIRCFAKKDLGVP